MVTCFQGWGEGTPRAVMAGPQTSSGRRPKRSASRPAGMFISSLAVAYTVSVAPTAVAPTPKLCEPGPGSAG